LAVFSVGMVLRIVLLMSMTVSVWFVFNAHVQDMKAVQREIVMEDITKEVQEIVLNAIMITRNNQTYYESRVSLPNLEREYRISAQCRNNNTVMILATVLGSSENFTASDNLNCSGLSFNGELSPGETCIKAQNNGTWSITLGGYCASV